MTFEQWIDKFCEEKEYDLDESFEVNGPSGPNWMSYQNVIDAMKATSSREQYQIKSKIIMLDYRACDIKRYIRHLAQAIAL